MKITVAKALKVKNRLVNKISDVSSKIQTYNSVVMGKERPVSVTDLMTRRDQMVDTLINIKTAISLSNATVQSTIYLLAELKGELNFLRGIDTTSGKQVNEATWGSDAKIYEKDSVLDYATVQGLIAQVEADIDANQDRLDTHNHTVEIDIFEGVLDLIKG